MDEFMGMTEREQIAYRRGFDDGLAAMREKIKDLLLENERLRMPILDGPRHPAVSRDLADSRMCVVFGGELNGHTVCDDNGEGRT